MVWSYTPMLRDVDKVRFEIGDTDENNPLLQDEEIQYAIEVRGNILRAAAWCCEVIARRLAAKAEENVGDLSIRYKAEEYAKRAKELAQKVASMGLPSVPEEKLFRLGMHDAPATQGTVS